MAEKVFISELQSHIGKEVTISGWLYNKTGKGKLAFLMMRDGTGLVQAVVFKGNVEEEIFEECQHLPQESALHVTGTVAEDKRAKGGCEIQVSSVKIVHKAEEYPISPKEHGVEFLMDHRDLWLRSTKQHAIIKVRHEIIKSCRDYFDNNGFTLVDAPIFTPSACEGTTNLFEVNYFDEKAYLTQSGQLYMEPAASAFGKVYCFGPTFRAEKSKTRRHLTEFWMVEPEMAYCDLNQDMDQAESLVSYIVERVLETRREELEILERDIAPLEKVIKPFPRIDYDDAANILKEAEAEFVYGDDFGGADETIISAKYDKPVMITHYPANIKAFYMKNDPERPDRALCVDMIAPEGYGEIIGGGQREDDYDTLMGKIKKHDLPMDNFKWYLDVRRYGSVPHAGFGLGIERTVAWLCGRQHVRETIPFPRMLYRLYP